MKKLLFAFVLMLAISSAFSQTNFKWVKSDTISKSKTELFSDTKNYLTENFSDTNGIQSENEDAGTIMFIGNISKQCPDNINKYNYAYTLKFIFIQSKYSITIENVHCLSAYNDYAKQKFIEPFEGDSCPKISYFSNGISKRQAIKMIKSLKDDLQHILDDYEKNIKKKTITTIKEKLAGAVIPFKKEVIIQNTISDSVRLLEKKFLDFTQNYQADKKKIDLSGLYLKKAANNSFAGMALVVVSAGCSVLGAVYQTKATLAKTNSMKPTNTDVASVSFIAGGVFALASLICYINVPINIKKAGEKLRIIK